MEMLKSSSVTADLISFKTVLIILAIRFVVFLYSKRQIFKFALENNGPKYPTFGQCKLLVENDGLDIVKILDRTYGCPCNLWVGTQYVYLTIEPSEVKTILMSPLTQERASYYNEVLFKIFHNCIFDKPYALWKRDRKLINRQFSLSLFKYFVPKMYDCSCKFGNNARNLNGFFSVSRHVMQLSFEAFAENIFRVDLHHLSPEVEELIYRFHQTLLKRKTSRLLGYNTWKKYTKSGQSFDKTMKEYLGVLTLIIETYKKSKNKKDENFDSKLEGFIGAFLEDDGMTAEDLIQNMNFSTIAAMDTSANSLAYAFLLLGMNPEIQEKVYEEVLSIVGLERPILKEDLPYLKFTERVLLETLRLFPVIPIIGRKTIGDLNLGTKTIPKGCDLTLPIFLIHRNVKYWPEPLEFLPDRFLPENVEKFVPGTYLPFVIGPKDCLGKTYALTFMKVFLASVIRRFKFFSSHTTISDFKYSSYITMVPATDLDLQVIPRDSQ